VQPLIGALLRLPREYIVQRMFHELQQAGFDLSESELPLFMFPGPDGRRPIELARQCNMTRQAMNYVLAGLEGRGYIVRQAEEGARSTTVQLTERGRAVFTQMRSTVVAVEAQWRAHLGPERFNALRETLQDLSSWVTAAASSAGRTADT
jgi:DNA-binding MarR family transcriptional regulator